MVEEEKLQTYLAWLKREATLKDFWRQLPIIFLSMVVIVLLALSLSLLVSTQQALGENGEKVRLQIRDASSLKLLLAFTSVPFVEEFIFRFVPLTVTSLALMSRKSIKLPVLLTVAIMSSLIFGYLHGPSNVVIQGSGGMVLSSVFLKWSKLGETPFDGLIASSVVHATFNAPIVCLLYMGW